MALERRGLGHVVMVAYSVDLNWYRGAQPSGMAGFQMPIYGSAATTGSYGIHVADDTENQAGATAAQQAAQGIVPPANAGDPSTISLGSLLGTGSPMSIVTPAHYGQQYTDVNSNHIWVATGTTNTSWKQVK